MNNSDLICPECSSPLLPQSQALHCGGCPKVYRYVEGVPYFLGEICSGQSQTAEGFSFKWRMNANGFERGQLNIMKDFHAERFDLKGPKDFQKLMEGKLVLDAGVGSGEAENFFIDYPRKIYGVDISESVHVAHRHWGHRKNFTALRADIMNLPFPDNYFDVIWSDGVLHHTPDTRKALAACVRALKEEGLILFYIYVKKAPVREFVDDLVRKALSPLPPKDAFDALKPLTALARDLSRLGIEIRLEEDIPYLGIQSGEHNLQRFLYWHFLKLYWNEELSFEGNNAVNFDWYYPSFAHRHTAEQVTSWVESLFLQPLRFQVNQSGISVVAQKKSRSGASPLLDSDC